MLIFIIAVVFCFVAFHALPATILVSVIFFWLFVFPHADIAKKNMLIATAVASVAAIGIEAYQAQWREVQQTRNQQESRSAISDTKHESSQAVSLDSETCNPSASEAAYARYMHAHEYRNLAHQQRGDWVGGVWMASGPDCSVFLILTADAQPVSFKTYFTANLGGDLCGYGFTAISFNGEVQKLDCYSKQR